MKEQLFILKKSLKDPTINDDYSSNIFIDVLNNQIKYLKEENKIKNEIIQTITSTQNFWFSSNAD